MGMGHLRLTRHIHPCERFRQVSHRQSHQAHRLRPTLRTLSRCLSCRKNYRNSAQKESKIGSVSLAQKELSIDFVHILTDN